MFPSGDIVVDMFDDSSIEASSLSINMIFRGDALLDFTFQPSVGGEWILSTTGREKYDTKVN